MLSVESPKKDQSPNQITSNAVGYTSMVEVRTSLCQNLVREVEKDVQQYRKQIQLFRQELSVMKKKIQNNRDNITDTTHPLIQSLARVLELGMINQKQQNANFQSQIDQLRKQKYIINQMIVETFKRTGELNVEVGFY